MVTICCVVFNHKNTINKVIDSFLMQKTNFNYQILIHDDCSTDGTIDILKKYENQYPEKIKVIYQQENQFSKCRNIAVDFMFPKINSKYIALCDGDDWWTDKNKLQMQIDLLESNNSLTGCFHLTEMIDLETNQFIKHYPFKKERRKKIFTLKDNFFAPPTSSVVYRFDIFKEKILSLCPNNIVNVDTWFASFYLLNGNIAYINKAMSVRTINGNGIWAGKNSNDDTKLIKYAKEFINFPIEMKKLFKKYGKNPYFDLIEHIDLVMNNAIKLNKTELIQEIGTNYFKSYYEENQIKISKIKTKYKKYKKISNLSILLNILLTLTLLLMLLK